MNDNLPAGADYDSNAPWNDGTERAVEAAVEYCVKECRSELS